MIALEEGPLSIFAILREKVDPLQSSWLGRGLNCPLCVSFWVGIFFAGLSRSRRGQVLVLPLALSGIASLLYKMEREE